MSSQKRKIIISSRKLDDKEYCFKPEANKHYNSRVQIYGADDPNLPSDLDILVQIENYEFIPVDETESERNINRENAEVNKSDAKKPELHRKPSTVEQHRLLLGDHFTHEKCLKIPRVIKSVSFILSLIFIALLVQKYGNSNINLYLAAGFSSLTLILDGGIDLFLFVRYKRRNEVP
jgi:hypothetical protein